MPEPKKRIVVDGVEFGQIFVFPRLFGAVTAALQPQRLLIALFVVVALIAFGRAWDGLTPPNMDARGLEHGRYQDANEIQMHQAVLRDAMTAFAPAKLPADPQAHLEADDVLDDIAEGYRSQRAAATSTLEREDLDGRYVQAVSNIHETRPLGDFEAVARHVSQGFRDTTSGVLSLRPDLMMEGLNDLVIETPRSLWIFQTWFAIIFGLFAMVVVALGGGAIARMAATQAATGERVGFRAAVDFALERWGRLIWALLLPLLIVAFVCAAVLVMGLLMAAPVLDVVGGVLYGLALVFGFIIAFLIIGYALGFPLLVPAVACENCDGADAMQRAYAYAVTRPLHLLWYWLVAIVALAIGFLLVSLVARVMLNGTAILYDTVSENPALQVAGEYESDLSRTPSPLADSGAWHHRWAATAILFWQALVLCLVGAYVISFFFSASTIGYLLMRRASDGQDIDEIWHDGLVPGTFTPEPAPIARSTVATVEAEREGLD